MHKNNSEPTREEFPAPESTFALASLPVLACALSDDQRSLLDAIWQSQSLVGKPFPKRSLPHVIGKRPFDAVVAGMMNGLFVESNEGGVKAYLLTLYGAFLTSAGPEILALLVRLLDLVKVLYEEDISVKQVDYEVLHERLGMSENESLQLACLLQIVNLPSMPCYLSGRSADRMKWYLTITDDVIELFHAPSSEAFLNEQISLIPRTAPSGVEHMLTVLGQASLLHEPYWTPTAPPKAFELDRDGFLAPTRLAALKQIDHSEFDCTRLIFLCDELNECAERANAHAVIMLTRAVLDHVPPVFGYKTFKEVASNYGPGGQSFKQALDRLENQTRKVADRLLHLPIRRREVAPAMKEVDFSRELEMLLAEFCRILKAEPQGTTSSNRQTV